MSSQENLCGKCEEVYGETRCSCGEKFCAICFEKHTKRNNTHRKAGSSKIEKAWSWISGSVASLTDEIKRPLLFQDDECTKWFGLVVEKSGSDRITRIIETPRFSSLVEESVHFSNNSPSRQFPSIVSFVGDTGAGKSTLSKLKSKPAYLD